MLKSPTSRWVAGAAGLCAALLVLTWFVLVGPKRAEAADLADQTESARQQNDALQIRTAQLKAQFATLPQRQAELATLAGQMPVTGDVPRFLRSLDTLATSAGVTLDGVTPGAGASMDATPATPGAAAAPAQAQPPAAAGAAGSTSGGLDVIQVPMTITLHGPYFATVTFLKGLQNGQRAFLVGGLQVAVANNEVALTIQGRVFALPGAAAALTATTTNGATIGSAPAAPAPAAPVPGATNR